MAYAAPSFPFTKETTNYARLCRLLVDVGTVVVRETFDRKHSGENLCTVLSRKKTQSALESLRARGILNPLQWDKLYPTVKSSVSSRDFDITLLMVLLRNICGLAPPATGWDALPPASDTTLQADLARIKHYRNTVYGHASQASVDGALFNRYWKDIQRVLLRLGGAGYQDAIDNLKKERLEPELEEYYKDLLKRWAMDEVSIKERLSEMDEKFTKKFDDLKVTMDNREKRIWTERRGNYEKLQIQYKKIKCYRTTTYTFQDFLHPICFCVFNFRWLLSIEGCEAMSNRFRTLGQRSFFTFCKVWRSKTRVSSLNQYSMVYS